MAYHNDATPADDLTRVRHGEPTEEPCGRDLDAPLNGFPLLMSEPQLVAFVVEDACGRYWPPGAGRPIGEPPSSTRLRPRTAAGREPNFWSS